jgi:hypothetical protein
MSNVNTIKIKEGLKMKLSYEWKKMYRIFAMRDTAGTGVVSPAVFEKAAI